MGDNMRPINGIALCAVATLISLYGYDKGLGDLYLLSFYSCACSTCIAIRMTVQRHYGK